MNVEFLTRKRNQKNDILCYTYPGIVKTFFRYMGKVCPKMKNRLA